MFGTTPDVDNVMRPLRQRQPLAVRRDEQRLAHRFESIERLAHPHHDDVGDAASPSVGRGPGPLPRLAEKIAERGRARP